MRTTVAELLERLKVAEPCAYVVLKTKDANFNTFDVECVNPTSEFAILIPDNPKVLELEQEIVRLEEENEELEEENDAKAEELVGIKEKLSAFKTLLTV